jgi:hypothetical protein
MAIFAPLYSGIFSPYILIFFKNDEDEAIDEYTDSSTGEKKRVRSIGQQFGKGSTQNTKVAKTD